VLYECRLYMSALRKLSLSPAARVAALQRLPAPIVAEIAQAEQAKAERIRKQELSLRRDKLEAVLRERWPLAFRIPRPPLAIGVFDRILEDADERLSVTVTKSPGRRRFELAHFMKWWCSRPDYLDAVAHREVRVNLDGSEVGMPTPEQQEFAAERLWGPRAEAMLAKIRGRVTVPLPAA
jgi:hypothetical protein